MKTTEVSDNAINTASVIFLLITLFYKAMYM